MTDTYESGDDHHDSGAEQAMAHDGPVSEEPSTYEFDEHGAAATAEQEPHEDLGTQIRETQPGGRSATLPVIAAIIGVVLLGGAAWWQFSPSGKPSAPPQTAMTVPQPITPATPVPVAQTTADEAPMKPIGTVGGNTMPTTPAAEEIGQTAPAPANTPPAMPAPAVPATAAVSPTVASAAQAPMPSSTPSPAAMPMAASGSTALPSSGGDAQRIDALAARIDSLQKALDQANAQLGQMTGRLSSSGAPDDKAMQDRLDKMEHELADLRHSAPSPAAPVALPADMQVGEAHETARMPPAAATRKTRHHKPVAAKPAIAASHAKKKAAESQTLPQPPAKWVLRAATPDQAWVSTSATSSDLKPLQVGDNLPGIGRVVAIQHQGDNWVVQGTQGTIH